MRTMLSLIVSAFVFGLLAITTPSTGVAGNPMKETAFKQLIVKSSPWSVTWKSNFYDGTFKMRFAVAGSNITGEFFDNSGGRLDGSLEDIVIHDNQCVSFITSTSGTKFDYCLEESGALTGTYIYTSGIGETTKGTSTALPRAR